MTSFWATPGGWALLTFGQILLVTVGLLISCAFLIWGDRKLFAGVQMRKGPNVVGPFGLLQSFADLGKFLLKEMMIPAGADKLVFLLAPLISVTLALGAWAAMPFTFVLPSVLGARRARRLSDPAGAQDQLETVKPCALA